MAGLFALVLLVNTVCQLHKVQTGSIQVACDNETALKVFHPDYKPEVKHGNFDLVSATHELLKESPLQWKPEHVKGHQDDHVSVHFLPRLAKLNVPWIDQPKPTCNT